MAGLTLDPLTLDALETRSPAARAAAISTASALRRRSSTAILCPTQASLRA